MRVERVYQWTRGQGLTEHDTAVLDPKVRLEGAIRLGHISDTHLGKGKPGLRLGQMSRWLETLEGLKVDAVVHSGDLVEDPGDEEVVRRAFSALDEVSAPVFGVPGNHDVSEPGKEGEITNRWGPFPRSEEVGSLKLLLVDSMAWPPAQQRSRRERNAASESGFWSRGAVGPKQLEALADMLDGDSSGPQVLVIHHHLRQPVPAKPWYEKNADLMAPLADADELLDLVRRAGVELVLHGHRHQYVAPFAPFDDLAIVNAPSSTREAWPKRIRIIDVAREGGAARIWELARFQ